MHPVTDRRTLCVNPHYTRLIKGMDERDSWQLLDQLFRVTGMLEHQYRHRWAPNNLVFWDNRSVQHAAVHDYYPQRRLMGRVTIKGDQPVGPVAAASPGELRKFKVAR